MQAFKCDSELIIEYISCIIYWYNSQKTEFLQWDIPQSNHKISQVVKPVYLHASIMYLHMHFYQDRFSPLHPNFPAENNNVSDRWYFAQKILPVPRTNIITCSLVGIYT